MSIINRLTTWTIGQVLKAADLNGEFNNITNLLNNLDAATTAWTNVKGGLINGTTSVTAASLVLGTNTFAYSPLTSYTPTIAGCGSVTNISFWWTQLGKMIYIQGYFTPGTVAASTFSVTIPGTKTTDTTSLTNANVLGSIYSLVNATAFDTTTYVIFCDGSDTSKLFASASAISGHVLSKMNGTNFASNGDVSMTAWIPVTA